MSRRSFLKKLGVGTAGLGALSLVPGSALNVRSDGFSFYGGSGSGLDLDVDNSGNVSIPNGQVQIDAFADNIIQGRMDLGVIGREYGQIEWIDEAGAEPDILWRNNCSNTTAMLVRNEGDSLNLFSIDDAGGVQVPNGSLQVKGNTVWHAGNDGSGSGLDADKVDGQEASELGGGITEGWGIFKNVLSMSYPNVDMPTSDTRVSNTGPNYSGTARMRWAVTGGETEFNFGTGWTIEFRRNGNLISKSTGTGKVSISDNYVTSFTSSDTWEAYGHVYYQGTGTAQDFFANIDLMYL